MPVTNRLAVVGEMGQDEFDEAESIIERGLTTFVEVGGALLRIRDGRGYRLAGYSAFESYCQQRWGMTRVHADRLIQASEVVAALPPIGGIPANEAQARELVPLLKDEQVLVHTWRDLKAEYGEKVTAKVVHDAVHDALASEAALVAEPVPEVELPELSEREETLWAALQRGETVVLNYHTDQALIDLAEAANLAERVDRRTDWGNPFKEGVDGDRPTVVRKYDRYYLPHKDGLLARIAQGELKGKALLCWCSPEACHGDVLKRRSDA
jgi:hypothetical protein